ncbi:YraN family protein [Salinifilum aidingensis]
MVSAITGNLSDDDTRGRRHELGAEGERVAAQALERHGLTVLERNWHCRHGELDIIASTGDAVVFCEVRTRSCTDYGTPEESVRADKIRRVRELARHWLHERGLTGCRVRFDVLAVLWPPGRAPHVKHFQGVF